ncbi:hypothetical protein VTN77DRAFT_641 [Rasamsonia byssochlamydoides]|uniref:uncharacterized protein n=1 Tax=Rasamsonia byssochlamydoides TaxID=89139 RepID=UPI003743806A
MKGLRPSILSFSVLGLVPSAWGAGVEAWKSRTVYQVMTDRFALTDLATNVPCNTTEGLYCGGTWRGIINNLDYIQGMGFDAIMVSPIIQNLEGRVSYGEAYHGYWPQDLYTLNPHFGTEQDFQDLITALHNRSMYLMVDSVINNMAYMTNGSDPATSVNYSILTPFNQESEYHPYCVITDYENYPLAQRCWTGDNIVALPDLAQEKPQVASLLESWIQETLANYSIDGLRIDAAKHVYPDFLPQFFNASGSMFMTGEVFEQNADIICNYQKNYLPSVPNYPIYYAMIQAFTTGNTSALSNEIQLMSNLCPDVTALSVFSENHDISRFASYTDDMSLAMNVMAFTLLFDGVPMIYQGQEQHFKGAATPDNREALWISNYNTNAPLYQLAGTLNKIRKQAGRVDPQYYDVVSYPIYTGSSELALRKGNEGRQVILVLSTNGANGGEYTLTLPVSYEAGKEVTEIMTCTNYTVDQYGSLRLNMNKGQPRVLFPADQMGGSGLCGVGNWTPAGTPSQNNTRYGADFSSAATGSYYSQAWGMRSLTMFSSIICGIIVLMI